MMTLVTPRSEKVPKIVNVNTELYGQDSLRQETVQDLVTSDNHSGAAGDSAGSFLGRSGAEGRYTYQP